MRRRERGGEGLARSVRLRSNLLQKERKSRELPAKSREPPRQPHDFAAIIDRAVAKLQHE